MRFLKVIIGGICIAAAFWPARFAFGMLGVVRSRLATPPGPHVTYYVILSGRQLAPWQIYGILAVAAVTALMLVAGGVYLICAEPRKDN